MTDVAVLLCAGGGTRLRPLTDDRPKALLEVGGETILGRAARLLISSGVRELIVATGYRHEALRASLADCGAKVTFCHNDAFATTQNSVSLYLCAGDVAGRPFYKLDGDLLFHPQVIPRLDRALAPLCVAVDRKSDLGDEEMKVIANGATILCFGKKLDPVRCAGESIGIEKLTAAFGAALFGALGEAKESGRTDLYYEDVYSELIARGAEARVVDVSDLPWVEVDTPDDLASARRWMNEGKLDRSA